MPPRTGGSPAGWFFLAAWKLSFLWVTSEWILADDPQHTGVKGFHFINSVQKHRETLMPNNSAGSPAPDNEYLLGEGGAEPDPTAQSSSL